MALNRLDQLYRAVILDHSKTPRHKGKLDQVDAVMELRNPTCGDEIQVQIKLDKNKERVEDVAFDGQGCTISMASASMMTQAIIGKSLDEVNHLYTTFSEMVQGNQPKSMDELGDAMMLEGVTKNPDRVRCATLSLYALDKELMNKGKRIDLESSEEIHAYSLDLISIIII